MYLNTLTGQYPLTESDIKQSYPNTSFPTPFQPPGEYVFVFPVPAPVTTRLEIAREVFPTLTEKDTFEQVWEVVDIQVDMAADAIENLKQTLVAERLVELKNKHQTDLYTSIGALFPTTGFATIQFRNEIDRTNLANVAAGATALVMAGTPTSLMQYRTEDNVIQEVTAAEMLSIAMCVLSTKQELKSAYWKAKDDLLAIGKDPNTTPADVLAYGN